MPLRHFSLLVPGKNAARVPDTLSSRRMTHRVSVVHTRLTTATKGRKLDRLRRLRRRRCPSKETAGTPGCLERNGGGRRVVHLTLICSSLLFVRCRFLPLTRLTKCPLLRDKALRRRRCGPRARLPPSEFKLRGFKFSLGIKSRKKQRSLSTPPPQQSPREIGVRLKIADTVRAPSFGQHGYSSMFHVLL